MKRKLYAFFFYVFFFIQIGFSLAGSIAWILMGKEEQWIPYVIIFSTVVWISLATMENYDD